MVPSVKIVLKKEQEKNPLHVKTLLNDQWLIKFIIFNVLNKISPII